jgi:hypothetical protein
MASGVVFDPMRLLRIAPLITSTGSLVFATSELLHNSAFLQPKCVKRTEVMLSPWYSYVFKRGVGIVLFFNIATTSTAIANLWLERRSPALSPLSIKLYTTGLACAIGHLAFVPWVMPRVEGIVHNYVGKTATVEMGKWLVVHKIRMAAADFPAWLSFLGAVLATASL